MEPLQKHPHKEVKVPSKKARSLPDTNSAGSFATSETVGEVESYFNDFDRYIDDQEKMIHDRDLQSSSGAICGTPETLFRLDQQLDRGTCSWKQHLDRPLPFDPRDGWNNNRDRPLRFNPREPLTSQSSHHQILPKKSRQITADPTVPQSLLKSEINLLVDQLSTCSLGEKSFIKHNLERYSVATTATKTIRSRSEPSIALSQIGESSESRAPAMTEFLAQAVEAIDHIPSAPGVRNSGVFQAVFGPVEPNSAAARIPEYLAQAIKATFSGGIFWYHMACEILRDPPKFRSAYCEDPYSNRDPDLPPRWEAEFSELIALQRLPIFFRDMWTRSGMAEWIDRFGNTSVHMAAICGAGLPHLLCLMEHVDVNALNNAGQTFMHVLDPRWMSPGDMIELRDQLVRDGFIFHHRDMAGQTFLDTLKHREIKRSDFARCWLRPIIRKGKTFHGLSVEFTSDQLLDGRLVRKIFNEIGGHEEQWKMLGWESNGYQHLHCSSNINELLEPSYNPMLLKTKDCWDRLGRGLLHVAADDIAGPATPTKAQQQRSNATRLNLVKHLLSIGVDVNHHDDKGVTPLMAHVRCVTYQHAIVDELLQHGAEPNARDKSGNTALHTAIKLGNIDATKTLIGRGANVHARDWKCKGLLTVAHRAQRRAKYNIDLYAKITICIALIIDAGAIASPDLFHEWATPQPNGSVLQVLDHKDLGQPPLHDASNPSLASPIFLDPVKWGNE